jgi:hypothetical protein
MEGATMSETIYLPEVRCEISEGLTESDITVCVRDIEGDDQFIHLLPSMVNWVGETSCLPVGVIDLDTATSGSSSNCPSRRIPG